MSHHQLFCPMILQAYLMWVLFVTLPTGSRLPSCTGNALQVPDRQALRKNITRTEQTGQIAWAPALMAHTAKETGGKRGTFLNLHSLTRARFQTHPPRLRDSSCICFSIHGENYSLPWVPKFLSFFRHNVPGKVVIHFERVVSRALEDETVKLISSLSILEYDHYFAKEVKKFGKKGT